MNTTASDLNRGTMYPSTMDASGVPATGAQTSGPSSASAPPPPPVPPMATAPRYNPRGEMMTNDSRKSPALAGFLSFIPGLGQAYVGHYIHGFVVMLIWAGSVATISSGTARGLEPLFGMFIAFFYFFNIVDAVRKANAYNRSATGEKETAVPTDSPLVGGVILLVLGLFLTLRITFEMDFEFLEKTWPLGLLFGGGYLIWRYRRTQLELQAKRSADASWTPPSSPPSSPPPSDR